MRMKGFQISFVFGFSVFSVVLSAAFFMGSERSIDHDSLEKFLRNAKVVSIDKGRGRRTESWQVELMEDGIQMRGFFKLTDRPRPDPRGGDSYKYVIAAYELDKMLELDLVPPTVDRKIKGNRGSLMLFLDPPLLSERDRQQKNISPPDAEKFIRDMAAVNVFEHLIFFPCLCNQNDPDNILIQTENGWKVWMIDLSTAFAPANRLIRECPISCCPKELFEQLLNLDETAVKARLSPFLMEEELNALMVRRDLIVERIKELVAEKGEDAVLPAKKIKKEF